MLGDVKVLAAEVADNKRLLAMMLYLSTGAKAVKDVVSLRVYEARKVRVKKRVKERVEKPWGTTYDDVEKEVLEEQWSYYPLPQSTAYRILKRLRELGLVEAYRGLDYRKRYYKLTELGHRVANKLKEMLLELLRRSAEKKSDKLVIEASKLEELAKNIGIETGLLIEALGLRRAKNYYGAYYALPSRA